MYPYQIPNGPTPQMTPSTIQPDEVRQRGGCLTAWLGVSLAASLITGVLLLQMLDLLRPGTIRLEADRQYVLLVVFLLGGLLVGMFACLYGIWNWKRWGVYGIAALSVASLLVSIILDVATSRDFIQPFTQNAVLWFLIRKKWQYFE
jgi:hypothetical protein